jgi:hypothetical protein
VRGHRKRVLRSDAEGWRIVRIELICIRYVVYARLARPAEEEQSRLFWLGQATAFDQKPRYQPI